MSTLLLLFLLSMKQLVESQLMHGQTHDRENGSTDRKRDRQTDRCRQTQIQTDRQTNNNNHNAFQLMMS